MCKYKTIQCQDLISSFLAALSETVETDEHPWLNVLAQFSVYC